MTTRKAVRFLVSCRHCQRPVMTVFWTDEELRALREHLRQCAPGDLGADSDEGDDETLRHFRVVPVEAD